MSSPVLFYLHRKGEQMKVLIIPGYQSSLEGHWQDWLLGQIDGSDMVYQDSWDYPNRKEWVNRLVDVIESQNESVLLVAHSMGSVTVAAMVQDACVPANVLGAIVVAPADADSDYLPKEIQGFSPMPETSFTFPSLFIASESDPYMSFDRACFFADKWGSSFLSLGEVGHINTVAGFGEWPQIVTLISDFLDMNSLT